MKGNASMRPRIVGLVAVVILAVLALSGCLSIPGPYNLDTSKLAIGMSSVQVASMETPNAIYRTVTAGHVYEQWIYRNSWFDILVNPEIYVYLYFDNGILTSWQD
jgi:hypothetical protein